MIINILKADESVVDVDQTYDTRTHDNASYPDGTIPAGENPRKYKRVAGNIVKRQSGELVNAFDDEWVQDIIARINASGLQQAVKDLLIEIIRRFVKKIR